MQKCNLDIYIKHSRNLILKCLKIVKQNSPDEWTDRRTDRWTMWDVCDSNLDHKFSMWSNWILMRINCLYNVIGTPSTQYHDIDTWLNFLLGTVEFIHDDETLQNPVKYEFKTLILIHHKLLKPCFLRIQIKLLISLIVFLFEAWFLRQNHSSTIDMNPVLLFLNSETST